MSTTKVPPPRKLEEKEDLDSFEDFWFQVETYYGRDQRFADIINDPTLRWRGSDVHHRGMADAESAANLNTLLRALATYALGPYIKKNIMEKATSLSGVKREFMKLLEIDLADATFMNFYDIKRRVNERPLMFYHRLRYHAERHLLKVGDRVDGVALREDEKMSPTLERLIVMEWLRRIDERLVKFIQEKFATELNYGSSTLISLVETMAKNMETYVSGLNRGASVQGVTQYAEPPVTMTEQYQPGEDFPYYENNDPVYFPPSGEVSYANFQTRGRGQFGQSFRPRGQFPTRSFNPRFQQPRPHPQFRPRGGFSNSSGNFSRQSGPVCEYCYLQVQTRRSPQLDYHHNISNCDQVSQMMQTRTRVGYTEQAEVEDTHEYSEFVDDFNQFGIGDSQQ